jgi:hypothetical protein
MNTEETLAQLDQRIKLGEEMMKTLQEELRPLSRMYHAILGCGAVGTLLCAVVTYIYINDRADSKAMNAAIYTQGIAIQRLLTAQESIERDLTRLYQRQDERRK